MPPHVASALADGRGVCIRRSTNTNGQVNTPGPYDSEASRHRPAVPTRRMPARQGPDATSTAATNASTTMCMENCRGSIHIGQYASGKARPATPSAATGYERLDGAGEVRRSSRMSSQSVPSDNSSLRYMRGSTSIDDSENSASSTSSGTNTR